MIRVAYQGGVPATRNIQMHANRLAQMSSYGKYGGYLLAGVEVAASCKQIADTGSRLEKNEIFVETIASVGTGWLAGGLALFLVSSPVGWGTAFLLAAGTVVASYTIGKTFRFAYTTYGNKVDLVNGVGVDQICQ